MANKKSSNSFIFLLIVVLAFLCIFFYKTNPEFKNKVDQKIESVKSAFNSAGEIISELNEKDSSTSSDTQKTQKKQEEKASQSTLISVSETLAFPFCKAKNSEIDHELRDFQHYSICYRESYEQAEWSAYCLDDSELEKNASRSDDFREDPKISTSSATLADYRGSGFDRGHLSPAADFAFSKEAMSETFYMSNMSPQAGSFNRGIWKDLEAQVRVWARQFGRVFVVSGPVLDEKAENYSTIGTNKVAIPKYYYKVILAPLYEDEEDRKTKDDAKSVISIGFIFPNTKCTDSFYNYAVTVDEVEKRTGIDFFYELEDSIENKIESGFEKELWN